MAVTLADFRWTLQAPRENFRFHKLFVSSRRSIQLVFIAALFSRALAQALRSQSVGMLGEEISAAAIFGRSFFSGIILFSIYAYSFYRVLQWKTNRKILLSTWLDRAMMACIPLLLLLPLVQLTFVLNGVSGETMYLVIQTGVYVAVLRRWVWALESCATWPAGVSWLMVCAPFLFLGLLFLGVILMMGAVFAFSFLSGFW